MTIVAINHATQMLSRLVSQYVTKPRFRAFLAAIAAPPNNLETAFTAIGNVLDPTVSEGQQLDICGGLVGVSRTLPNGAALTDDEYRIFVLAKIVRNKCKGTMPEMRAALRFIFDPTNDGGAGGVDVIVQDREHMSIECAIGREPTANEIAALGLNDDLLPRPSGVQLDRRWQAAGCFGFSSSADPGVPILTGALPFETHIPPTTGRWAGVF